MIPPVVAHHGRSCERCAAWDSVSTSRKDGRCRRWPPAHGGQWPLTKPNDWCLESKPEFYAQKPAES